jgi:predicted nucleotidyltransferase
MDSYKKILDSFSIKETLNPKVWENCEDPKKAVLIPKIRKALLRISEEFIDDLGDDIFVDDIYLMGSLANFNWSEYSDFDLHVIIDFERYGKQEELYKELFDLKKKLFNDKHNIKIFGYDVELYAQGLSDESHSDGVYSVMNNEWIHRPTKTHKNIDMSVLKTKIKCWTDKIDDAIDNAKSEGDAENLKKLKDKLKDYRQSGLNKDGEFSYENLVFKYLRRSGHIGKLFDEKTKIKDKELSVERNLDETRIKKPALFEQVEDAQAFIDAIGKLANSLSKDPTVSDAISSSPYLTTLNDMMDNNVKYEYTPGQKTPYFADVEEIQKGLQILGHSLPKWGIDGKFGEETEEATKKFQEKNNMTQTGVFGTDELTALIENLIESNFTEDDLNKVQKNREFKSGSINSSLEFRDAVETITNKLEGGYFHPYMKEKNPSKFAWMGDSGETMFGMDRKKGQQEKNSSAGVEFWRLIDAEDAKNNWKYGYALEDNSELKNKLYDLIAQIMEPQFIDSSNRYLSDESKSIVMSDPKLFFNFAYASYNGPGWFQKFAKKFNQKVEEGVTDIEKLRDYALQIRKESGNWIIATSGNKIEKIFDGMP